MSKRVITFNLDLDGIDHAIREIERYRNDFMKAADAVLRELTEKLGKEYQIAAISELVGDSKALQTGASGYYDEGKRIGFVRNETYFAVFVEFGTGVVGAAAPYTGRFMPASVSVNGYGPYDKYDTNEHGEAGWWYYDKEGDGQAHWTKGQPSRPFFYQTYQNLVKAAPEVAARIFGETLK